ncbi:MAG: alpha/beta hydrolase [Blastopirellula sp.]|nr:MAG: alpha/beta hydrolase [Blastopirellula sp.]
MRHLITAICLTAMLISTSTLFAQAKKKQAQPPKPEPTRTEVYKTIGDVELRMHIFEPAGHKPSDNRPAIVFFFGGGWKGGTPNQFYTHCKHLADKGMLAMSAEYRVSSRHNTTADKCVADAKSSMRWIRNNAVKLGVNPDMVAAGGGSAGGHLAACLGTIEGFNESGESTATSSVPQALLLFNPACVLDMVDGETPIDKEKYAGLEARMGTKPVNLSPYHHVKKDAPPTIIFHGIADTTVPYRTAELFTNAMKEHGNRCELKGYPGQGHGFFNYGRDKNKAYDKIEKQVDAFLVSLGFLEG